MFTNEFPVLYASTGRMLPFKEGQTSALKPAKVIMCVTQQGYFGVGFKVTKFEGGAETILAAARIGYNDPITAYLAYCVVEKCKEASQDTVDDAVVAMSSISEEVPEVAQCRARVRKRVGGGKYREILASCPPQEEMDAMAQLLDWHGVQVETSRIEALIDNGKLQLTDSIALLGVEPLEVRVEREHHRKEFHRKLQSYLLSYLTQEDEEREQILMQFAGILYRMGVDEWHLLVGGAILLWEYRQEVHAMLERREGISMHQILRTLNTDLLPEGPLTLASYFVVRHFNLDERKVRRELRRIHLRCTQATTPVRNF